MSSFVHFIAAAGSGITPPSPGAYSLLDTLSATAYPFQTFGTICISRDGYTVFATGYNVGALGVWVWRWNGTNWPNLQILAISTPSDFPISATSHVSDHTLTCNEDGSRVYLGINAAVSNKGVAYVFEETSPDTWAQIQRITNPTGTADYFGWALACDLPGDRIAIGAPAWFDGTYRGKVHIYLLSGGSYSLEQTITSTYVYNTGGTGLGHFVALSGDGSVLATGDDDYEPTFIGSGAVETHTRSGTTWSYEDRRYPVVDDAPDYEFSGAASRGCRITEDGSTIYLIAEIYNNIAKYTRSGGVLVFGGLLKEYGTTYAPRKPMGASADGQVFVVGNWTNTNSVTEDGQVDRWEGEAYVSTILDSTPANSDHMGFGVDVSADGAIVVWTIPQLSSSTPGPGDRVYMKVY